MPLIKSTLKLGNNTPSGHDNIVIEGEFVGNLIPDVTGTYDIGSPTKFWNNLYVANLKTNITNRSVIFSDHGTLTGSNTVFIEGNAGFKRMSIGTSSYYGKLSIYDSSPAPYQSGASYFGNQANYQLNVLGGNVSGWGSGISFGYTNTVGASIIQKNVGNGNQSDLLFLTKEDTVVGNDPTLRMVMRYDGKVGIGNTFIPYGKLSVYDQSIDVAADPTVTTNYHLGLYGTAIVGKQMGISFGTTGLVGSAIVHKNTGVNNEGELIFYTQESGVVHPQMTIKSDGRVGINVEDPFADLEVEGKVGISNTTNGGELQFQYTLEAAAPFYNYPSNTTEIGRIRFGNKTHTQASVYGVADENPAWSVNARGANVVISGTPVGSTTESPIAIFDHTQTDFVSPVNVNNSVTALLYYGNGQFLTGIAKGQPTQMQYNDNGVLNGGIVYYENTTGKVIMGANSNGFSSKLLIHDGTLNAYTDLASVSSYHLHISGSNTNGRAMGIGFGRDSSGVGGAVLFEDTGSYNKGDLVFLTKSSTISGVAPVERVRIHAEGIDIKGSSGTFGGRLGFENGTNYPQAGASVGLVSFGSPLSDNALIRGGVPSDWNSASRETDLTFWVTEKGSTSLTEMLKINSSGLTVDGDVTVNGDVDATSFIGDGSQLTNLPIPSAAGAFNTLQYNNNGTFGGANVFFYSATSGLSIGYNNSNLGGGLSVYNGSTLPMNNLGDISNYPMKIVYADTVGSSTGIAFGNIQNVGAFIVSANAGAENQSLLNFGVKTSTVQGAAPVSFLELSGASNNITARKHLNLDENLIVAGHTVTGKNISIQDTTLQVHADNNSDNNHLNLRGSATLGEGSSIGFGASNKTAQIATYNTSYYGYGDLIFRVKTNFSNQGMLDEYQRLGAGRVKFSKRIEVNSSVNPALSPTSNSGHQIQLQGEASGSSGISFGTVDYNSWSIVADQESSTSRRARLKFLYPDTSDTSDTSLVSTSAFCITEDGRVGIHNDDPEKEFVVEGEVLFRHTVGAYHFLQHATSTPTNGTPLGTIAFGTDDAPYAAFLRVLTANHWHVNNQRSTDITLYGTKLYGTSSEEIYRWNAGGTDWGHNFKGPLRLSDGNLLLEGGFSIIGSFQANVHSLYASATLGAEHLSISDDAVVAGDLTMGFGGQINCNQYWWRASTTTRVKKIELTEYETFVTNGDFIAKGGGTNNNEFKTLKVDSDTTHGMVLIGTENGVPHFTNFVWGQGETGLYVEGEATGGHDDTRDTDDAFQVTEATSVMTVCNRNKSNTQVVMDILAGAGVYDSSFQHQPLNYAGWVTSNTSFIRFLNKNRGSSSTNSENSKPKRVGRIRGDGSGGIDYVSSFTGMHATVTELKPEHKVGMIMVSTGEIWIKGSVETRLPRTAPTDIPKDKRVYGILGELEPEFSGYSANTPPRENESQVQVYSIGEGAVLVTNIGGNIENGDYICSSEILGYGMLQDDDLLHNYTVAKCTETINWDDPELETIEHNGQVYKIYLAACTYHCG